MRLTADALHAGEADTELVLQQLTHAAYAAVAEMVYIIGRALFRAEVRGNS